MKDVGIGAIVAIGLVAWWLLKEKETPAATSLFEE